MHQAENCRGYYHYTHDDIRSNSFHILPDEGTIPNPPLKIDELKQLMFQLQSVEKPDIRWHPPQIIFYMPCSSFREAIRDKYPKFKDKGKDANKWICITLDIN